ncbi:hypothetical protein FRC01_002158 [Tulasnella sp. 417]|nr:hypothetical protein FRC01_002158 [Tulasnella sp. 417]
MRFSAPALLIATLFAESVLATDCLAGNYLKKVGSGPSAYYTCTPCPAGEYTTGKNKYSCNECDAGQTNNSAHTGCENCPTGWYSSSDGSACQPCPAGKQPNSNRTGCSACPSDKYSPGGAVCSSCPKGTEVNDPNTGCDKCEPGWYNNNEGSDCKRCPKGKFNNIFGAKSCCDCCAGWYSNTEGSTLCKKCSDAPGNRSYGPVGSDSSNKCTSGTTPGPNGSKAPTNSCSMVADNVCPNTTGGGPQGTAITRKRRDVRCASGLTACARFSGRGGFDCVDTENDPESCGGCVGLDGESDGTDCTAIKGVSVTRCIKRSCVIDSCRKGWVKSLDGSSCVLASHGTGSPEHLHAQDNDAKKIKRSSAKRAIRHTIF